MKSVQYIAKNYKNTAEILLCILAMSLSHTPIAAVNGLPCKTQTLGQWWSPPRATFTQSAEQKVTQAEISQTSPQIYPGLILKNAQLEPLCKAEGRRSQANPVIDWQAADSIRRTIAF